MSTEPSSQPEIENLMTEARTFAPDPAFVAQANAGPAEYAEAAADFEAFWAARARERLRWTEPFHTTLEWDLPFAKWFLGGRLNVSENCLDRHVENGLGDKVAYHWIGEPGDTRTLTYADLLREVGKAANALKELGVEAGDRVAIYMPMIPELPIAMLACARLGAAHTVIFGGFSAEALSDRINDAQAKVLITADGGWRRGKPVGLKHHADEALEPRLPRSPPRSSSAGSASERATWSRAATTGGTTSSIARIRSARPSRSTASSSCTCSTPRARRPSRRGSSTPRPATCWAPRTPTRSSSTSSPTTSTGARPISAGSPATATSSTARWPTRRPGSSTRAPRTRPTGIAGGRSSRTSRSRSCTARRRRSGRS